MPLPAAERPVTVLDLGSSEGRNAVHVMATIVERLRRRTRQPVQTIYSDLASNNFNQLFANLEEARRGGLFPAGVYPSALGGSFYGLLLPSGTVHLATSFNSIHWLDQLPAVPVPDFVAYRRLHPPRPGLTVSSEATAAFKRQSEQDLVRFLECRARELVPGASSCWPARAILTGPTLATDSLTCSTMPVSISSPSGG
jgi:cyclopropane-fatty-acyl-phospholipid synthase